MHPMGAGAYVNGVAFVEGKIYAATGGGRMYREAGSGFELIELPLRQARLVRLYELPSAKRTLRLLLVTNNSGVLLLATGAEEEPSLYQWSEDEGLCSRYVTAMAAVGEFVAVAVHGCVHVTTQRRLVSEPDELVHWGKVQWGEGSGAADHNRAAALCEHAGHLYIGTSAGLYRVPMARLEAAERETVVAERVDDAPVRHLVSCQGELWAVQLGGLGRYVDPAAPAPARVEPQEVEGRLGGLRSRLLGRRHAGRAPETHEEEMPAPGGCWSLLLRPRRAKTASQAARKRVHSRFSSRWRPGTVVCQSRCRCLVCSMAPSRSGSLDQGLDPGDEVFPEAQVTRALGLDPLVESGQGGAEALLQGAALARLHLAQVCPGATGLALGADGLLPVHALPVHLVQEVFQVLADLLALDAVGLQHLGLLLQVGTAALVDPLAGGVESVPEGVIDR